MYPISDKEYCELIVLIYTIGLPIFIGSISYSFLKYVNSYATINTKLLKAIDKYIEVYDIYIENNKKNDDEEESGEETTDDEYSNEDEKTKNEYEKTKNEDEKTKNEDEKTKNEDEKTKNVDEKTKNDMNNTLGLLSYLIATNNNTYNVFCDKDSIM